MICFFIGLPPMLDQLNRHARACPGHPRLLCPEQDVDGRDEPGHDDVAPSMRYSPLMPAAFTIGHHFSTSALWSAPRYSGDCCWRGGISWPRSCSRACTAGSASASTTAALSLPTMSFGVPLGAHSAN